MMLPTPEDTLVRGRPRTPFVPPDAPSDLRIRAAAANHIAWFTASSLAAGGHVRRENGATWLYTPGPNSEMVIAFPRMASVTAGATLDKIVDECRALQVGRVSCWSLSPPRPSDLGARLAARGFQWGFQPHWMSLDLRILPPDLALPDGLRIALDDGEEREVDNLPYYNREGAAILRAHAQQHPRRVWHFGAWREGKVVGHSLLYLTTGPLGVAGIYNVGVLPEVRRQGVGRAVMLAACRFAQSLGCHHVLLNSAASEFYARIGFVSLGWGQTWWMYGPALAAPPPTWEQVVFAEAVGRGDLKFLKMLEGIPDDLDAPWAGGMTPVELAFRAGKPRSVEWLMAHGATLDIVTAWDLGWKDRIPALLARSPEIVNWRSGSWQITPLHEAASRGDTELARLVLTARPNLELRDTQFNSTPLGWAQHLQRTKIIALIEEYQAQLGTGPSA